MMPAGRRRYGPILGQILRAKGPSVPLKKRAECPSDGSSYKFRLQIRRPSPDELGTGPTRLTRVTTTRRLLDDKRGWTIRGRNRRR